MLHEHGLSRGRSGLHGRSFTTRWWRDRQGRMRGLVLALAMDVENSQRARVEFALLVLADVHPRDVDGEGVLSMSEARKRAGHPLVGNTVQDRGGTALEVHHHVEVVTAVDGFEQRFGRDVRSLQLPW